MLVRVIGGDSAPSRVIELATGYGKKAGAFFSTSLSSQGQQRFYPATEDSKGYGFITRVFDNRVDVILVPPAVEYKADVPYRYDELLTLKHGVLSNLFIKGFTESPTKEPAEGVKKYVTYYDVLDEYKLKDAPQITQPASNEANKPAVFKFAIDESKFSSYWSHFTRVKPNMYTGHLREVVQIGMGIGHGSDLPEKQHEFKSITYMLNSLVSDGVVFVENNFPETDIGTSYELMKPVAVQINGAKKKVYVADLVYWDEAITSTGGLVDKNAKEHTKWMSYVTILEESDIDDLVKRIVEVYGGVPTPESPFMLETTLMKEVDGGERVPDISGAFEQRLKAGFYMEADVPEVFDGWHGVEETRTWAFDYTTPKAVQVQTSPADPSGYPKMRLTTLTFNIESQKTDYVPNELVNLGRGVASAISNGELDAIAAITKLKLMPYEMLAPLNEEFVLQDFINLEVPDERKPYRVTVEPSFSHEGFLNNPVGYTVHGAKPRIHFKFPKYYGEDRGCNTWLSIPFVELGAPPPPVIQPAPVDAFFTKDGELILIEGNGLPGDGEPYTETTGEDPQCAALPYATETISGVQGDVYLAGSNVYADYQNKRRDSGNSFSREITPHGGWIVSVSDDLEDLAHSWLSKHKRFIGHYTTKHWNEVMYTCHHAAPFNEREMAYLAEPRSGKSGTYHFERWGMVFESHPFVYNCHRCFPGYWDVDPTYHECGYTQPEGLCPSYPWQSATWFQTHEYPRAVTDDNPIVTRPPGPCDVVTGREPWAELCTNADQLVASNPEPPAPQLPDDIDIPPQGDYKVAIRVLGTGIPGGVKVTYTKRSEDADISEWWKSLSPDPETRLTAWAYASNNCSGAMATTVNKGLNGEFGILREGAAKKAPMKDIKGPLYIGVAIRGETSDA